MPHGLVDDVSLGDHSLLREVLRLERFRVLRIMLTLIPGLTLSGLIEEGSHRSLLSHEWAAYV